MDDYIVGRNAVKEALRSHRKVHRLLISADKGTGALAEIVKLAKEAHIEVRKVPEKQLQKYSEGLPHQGVAALVTQVELQDLDEVLNQLTDENPLLVLTDGIEDPHNLGAIIRTAECAGVSAVLIPKRHNATITATVNKTSAGAVEFIPLVQIGNVASTIKDLKKKGFWVLGAHMEGNCTLYEADLKGPTVIIVGNEGKGLSRNI